MLEICERTLGKCYVLANKPDCNLKKSEVNSVQKKSYCESIFFPLGTNYTMMNPFEKAVFFVEVKKKTSFGEGDLLRFDSKYNRQ